MRTRSAGLFALVGLALAPAAQAAEPSLSPTSGASFPERSFVLTLPERARVTSGQLRVTENGRPVRGVRVAPVGSARRARLGVLLAIDTSASMRGGALTGALRAARAFARQRNSRQPLAFMTFNSGAHVALRFTSDRFEIRDVLLRRPAARGGTHVYDATSRAIGLVRRAGLGGGFVVVLSDGADRGSVTTARAVAEAARAAHVRIYTVGLESRHFDPTTLGRLARGSGGSYSEASSSRELQAIYSALGAQLSNAYLVRYKSLAGPQERVEVSARLGGLGAASSSYTTPRLETEARGSTSAGGGWASTTAVVLVALVLAALIGIALAALVVSRRQTPRERVAQFVAQEEAVPRVSLTRRLVTETERSLSRTGWWASFEEEVEIGRSRSAAALVTATVAAALGIGLAVASTTGSIALALLVVALAPLPLRSFVRSRAARQRRRFSAQLADHLTVVAGALRIGHGLGGGFAAAQGEAPEPARGEFERAVTDERLGAPMEEALERVAERMRSRDVEQVAMLARLQREAGADAAEMIDRVVGTIRERQELRGMVRALTAQGRLARWILTLLPVVTLLGLTVTDPRYVDPLWHTGTGQLLLVVSAAMITTGSLIIKRLVEFEI